MTIFQKGKDLWMRFAHTLGRINTVMILTVFYFVVIGSLSIFLRLAFLIRPNRGSWKKKEPVDPSMDWLSHQF